ncbi:MULTISPECIES: helix-turn-helix domain-containing protein [Streptomyces]|uniref:Helix-turn-helix domain-containing protein n=1 Tax=Streptomyces solicathayae TaxID=3081768 RepID=A0ABZ0LW16_9ACTN|nr:helix-turn-helix domain-containing protein [Streptomyces sp. HUAS YS2]WOX23696.1 helix-turn-helix domain-containing protein [Streptomyces sp. HUAS YS2]
MWQGVSAAALPSADRFEWFAEMLGAALAPMAVGCDSAADFEAEVAVLDLGPVQLSRFAYSPLRTRRTAALIRRGDPEQYHVGWVTGGRMEVAQAGHESGSVAGDLVVMDTSRPQHAVAARDGGIAEALVLQVPRAELPLRADRVDRVVAQRIPAGAGMAAILTRFLAAMRDHGPECRPRDRDRLGALALELTASCLAERIGVLDEEPPEARPLALAERIDAFIDHNLGDPELTPRAIAERHHISLRTLYALFQEEETSVAATIRARRLERCLADLARPELRGHAVQAIAVRWGFTSGTVFSRAFREAYGMTPTEYRRQALCAATAARDVEEARTPRTPARRAAP